MYMYRAQHKGHLLLVLPWLVAPFIAFRGLCGAFDSLTVGVGDVRSGALKIGIKIQY